MTQATVTIQLPQEMYQRFKRAALLTSRSMEDVLFQSIKGNMPPVLDDLPTEWQDEFTLMQGLNDEALWAVSKETFPARQWQKHEQLLQENEQKPLNEKDQAILDKMRVAMDHFILRRSYALALLKWRGYTVAPAP